MLFLANNCLIRQHRVLNVAYWRSTQLCNPTLCRLMSVSDCSKQTKQRRPPCACGPTGGRTPNRVTYKLYVKPPKMDHDHKNMSLNRPMSPHLAIFKMTTPATMSIVQRATGTILTAYALLLAGGTLFLSNGVETYVSIIQSLDLGSTTVILIKLILSLPFAYHYFNGIRFCMWNMSRWLDMKQVSATATSCMIATAALTVFFAFFV